MSALGGDGRAPKGAASASRLAELVAILGGSTDAETLATVTEIRQLLAAEGRSFGDLAATIAEGRPAAATKGSAPPVRVSLDTADLPPIFRAPWCSASRWYDFDYDLLSADFALDDPEALRSAGPVAVAVELAGLATWGEGAPRRGVRQAAALLRQWLQDGFQHDDLDLDLGLRRRDGSRGFANAAKRAERNAILLGLARLTPWSEMKPRAAAQALRDAFSRFQATAAAASQKRLTTEPSASFQAIARLKFAKPVPSTDDLAALVAADRIAT